MRRALWTREFGGNVFKRHRVAQTRLGADYERGGLRMYETNFRALTTVLRSQAATSRFCTAFPDSFLAQLEDWTAVRRFKGSGNLLAVKKYLSRTMLLSPGEAFFSENKKYKSNLLELEDPPECVHCFALMDSRHQTVACIYMQTFVKYLRGYILTHEVTMKNWAVEEVLLEFLYFTRNGPSEMVQGQFHHLIIFIKILSFSAHLNPRWTRWSRYHLYANICKTVKKVIGLRRFIGRPVEELVSFQSHILANPNRTMLLEPHEWLR